jgi:hypothetical protein
MMNHSSPEHDDEQWDLPEEERALCQILRDVGTAWRASSPQVSALGEHLADRARQLTASYPTDTGIHSEAERSAASTAGAPYEREFKVIQHRTFGRLGGAVALIAAIALVIAFAGLFAFMTRGQGGPGTSPHQTTNVWITLTRLDDNARFDANGMPAIAPTDPQVVYESFAQGPQEPHPATLRRTDDGGATWHALSLPVPAEDVGDAGLAVSPLNAHVVYLSLVDDVAKDCPASRLESASEGRHYAYCELQFFSTDGGAHWLPLNLPLANGVPGTLTVDSSNGGPASILNGSLHAQGSTLYAGFNCISTTFVCTRLVTSTDGGIHWQFSDDDLVATARRVCDMEPAPSGSAIYAVTSPSSDCGEPAQNALTLWSSADAGAHWARMGTLPTPNEFGLRSATNLSGQTLLYAELPRTTSIATDKMGQRYLSYSSSPTDVEVSADGGATWQHAPTAGIPRGYKPDFTFGPLGPLPDGSVVVPVIPQSAADNVTGDNPSGATLYAWKPGDAAWRQIAPTVRSEIGPLLVTTSDDGNITLYLIAVNRTGGSTTYTILRDEM